jgi:hypothetical protein
MPPLAAKNPTKPRRKLPGPGNLGRLLTFLRRAARSEQRSPLRSSAARGRNPSLTARLALAAVLGLCCALPAGARAQDTAALGAKGQWLLGGSAGGTFEWQQWRQPQPAVVVQSVEHLSVWIAPRALLFVATDLALGAELWVGLDRYAREDDLIFTAGGIGGNLVLAYRVGLGESVFLLPELSLGVADVVRSVSIASGEPPGDGFGRFIPNRAALRSWTSATVLQATLAIPFAFSPAPHFFAGLGPYARAQWSPEQVTPRGDTWSVTIGVVTQLGTWF